MNLVIGFVNGKERKFNVDDVDVSEEFGYLKAYKNKLQVGMFSINQVCYWYVED